LGIAAVAVTLMAGLSAVPAQSETLTLVSWGAAGEAMRGGADGNVELIDYSVIDVTHVPANLRNDYCVGMLTYSTLMAYNTDTYGDKGPNTWADFWDVEKFPGTRSMRARPSANLEFALIADGVPMDKVYEVLDAPGGIERALDKMREIKPHVAINFNEGQLNVDCYYVPKGAPHKDMAMKLIGEMTKPKYQADLTKYIAYGPTHMEAYEIGVIPPERAAMLPSSPQNAKVQFVYDAEWWRVNGARAEEMFDEMLTE
jgi:putative spermidine/putrescine transport system substrate-binding protein